MNFTPSRTRFQSFAFCLVVLGLHSQTWSAGPPRTARENIRPVTMAADTPAAIDPLPVRPGQVIDEASGQPTWIVMLGERPAGEGIAPPSIDASIDPVLATANIPASRLSHRYRHAIVGFAGAFSPTEAGRLASDPRVVAVDPDLGGRLDRAADGADDRFDPPWEHRRISSPDGDAVALDRCGATGAGVTVVVIDSGVNADHSEFGDRVRWSVNFTGDDAPDGDDQDGHGTGVASIAAGATIGIAPESSIAALRVEQLSGLITNAAVIAALDWTVAHADELVPAVANLSLGGPAIGIIPSAYEAAFAAVEQVGIPIFVAAGNEVNPASWKIPAATFFASTIGATDAADHPTAFSNFGPFVDLWAPGAAILIADRLVPAGGFKLESGTSQATPMVAGVAALHLDLHPPSSDELQNSAWRIAHRTRLAIAASAAEGRLSMREPGAWTRPGQAILGGGPDLLLQSCTRTIGIEPPPVTWREGSASVRLGDGITPIPLDHEHAQFVNHPDGPVELTINLLGLPSVLVPDGDLPLVIAGSTVRIVDAADERVLFDSDAWIQTAPVVKTTDRVVRSSTSAGLRIDWTPSQTTWPGMPDGVGYAMTATLVSSCTGDLNGDGTVDGQDLPILLAGWGPCPIVGPCLADFDRDGVVDGRDLPLLLAAWGECDPEPAPGFVFDCNGREVLANYRSDRYLDTGDPLGRLVPVGRFGALSAHGVNFDCEGLEWDSTSDRFVISPSDPRTGACVLENNDCFQSSPFDCSKGGFYGADEPCDPVTLPTYPLPPVPNGWLATGHPWTFDPRGGRLVRIRQPLPPGVFSISDAFIVTLPTGVKDSVGFRLNPEAPQVGGNTGFVRPPTPFRVTIEFTDGGPGLMLDGSPETRLMFGTAFPPSNDPYLAYQFGVILPTQDREIASIEFSAVPTGDAPSSSVVDIQCLAAVVDEDDPDALPAEISKDGGRTWAVWRDEATGRPLERGLLILP
ncbi:MAG: S8 family serine peptidase [Phycisphaeraceae bacterium]|nr:S8 family serine peptidase [Phycisphaeraceae bacterium]